VRVETLFHSRQNIVSSYPIEFALLFNLKAPSYSIMFSLFTFRVNDFLYPSNAFFLLWLKFFSSIVLPSPDNLLIVYVMGVVTFCRSFVLIFCYEKISLQFM